MSQKLTPTLLAALVYVTMAFTPTVFADDPNMSCTPPDCTGCGSQEAACICNPERSECPKVSDDNSKPLLMSPSNIRLLQSPDDDANKQLTPKPGLGNFFEYFNLAWPWLRGIAVGIAILWGVIGGVEIMLSGSASASAAGKDKIMWALVGLLLVGLAGFLLNTLNPLFFVQP